MKLLNALKKKGFKVNILKIPTRKTPRQIEHQILNEFHRGRAIRTLRRVYQFLDAVEAHPEDVDVTRLSSLLSEVNGLITTLSTYKK